MFTLAELLARRAGAQQSRAGDLVKLDQSRAGAADLLTRTTLQMENNLSPRAIGDMIAALQRVPGVLLAEMSPGNARAVVAHDAAVPSASLLQAALRTGVRLKLAPAAPAASASATAGLVRPLAGAQIRGLLMLAAALLLLPVLNGAISPLLAHNHLLLPVLLACVWGFAIALAMFRRVP